MTEDYAAYDRGRGLDFWARDPVLRAEVARTIPADARAWAEPRLEAFGGLVGGAVDERSAVVDRHGPVLHTHDRDGDLVNEIEYHPAQLENERAVYEAGIVADSFRAPPGRGDRLPLLHHLAMVYLLGYSDIGLACPVAMTAGTAMVLERFDDGANDAYLEGLVARGYDDLLQGAMFLTERQGGSDVGATATVARPADGVATDEYRLEGEKWFCSNLDAGVALALARRPDAPPGTEGLSLFLVPRWTREGERNPMRFRRLKDKLGTVSVPTGEIEFEETVGYLVGEPERGFRYMTEMLNLERLANAFGACGVMGRAVLESKIKAANREAFGARLIDQPLMRRDLVELAVTHEAATAFVFDAAEAYEAASRDDDEEAHRLMRVLVPVAKHRTGRLAVDVASYAMEIQGGNGYVAEWVTHRLLRDAQVLPIWEGTSNVLSLDLLRSLSREGAHEAVVARIRLYLDAVGSTPLVGVLDTVEDALAGLEKDLSAVSTVERADAEWHAKALADRLYDVYTAALLLAEAETAIGDGTGRKALVARRFVDATLRTPPDRVVDEDDRLPDAWFDAIVRSAPLDPDEVATPAATVD